MEFRSKLALAAVVLRARRVGETSGTAIRRLLVVVADSRNVADEQLRQSHELFELLQATNPDPVGIVRYLIYVFRGQKAPGPEAVSIFLNILLADGTFDALDNELKALCAQVIARIDPGLIVPFLQTSADATDQTKEDDAALLRLFLEFLCTRVTRL